MARFPSLPVSWPTAFVSSLALLSYIIPTVRASDDVYIEGTDAAGVTRELLDSRFPALYTRDFGDCMGGQSLINITAFDAAYYADNMTVLFHLSGTTNLRDESIMLYISVEAYGENRFDLTFSPCNANFASLCPLNSSVPVAGEAIIPVSSSDVSGIPNIALSIPDFEGSAILRIFSNATRTQIGCFEAVMSNGASFSHPAAIGSVLGVFTVVALLASFATAIYGVSVPHIRTHYAHSLSVLVIFEVFHSIFFSGALSLNWPSVCAAFWSNFAWSAGMIYSPSIMNGVGSFVGISGNSSQVGGAGSALLNDNGGLEQQIYGRSMERLPHRSSVENLKRGKELAKGIYGRAANSTASAKTYNWAGGPAALGLPIPGNWSGFAGELSELNIPAADAFVTGLLWFVILICVLVVAITALKWSLEWFSSMKWMKQDRLTLFRTHWGGFIGLAILRSLLVGFFMMTTLTLYQFSYGGKVGVTVIAVITFLIFFAGLLGLAAYACFFRLRFGRYQSSPDRVHFQGKRVMKILPWFTTVRASQLEESDRMKSAGSVSFFRVDFVPNDSETQSVHDVPAYTKHFGWLSSRFRRTRWWFFVVWIVYQFGRACFIGGARANPTVQVYGIFVWEIVAFVVIVRINPFEGARNTALAVYMLGISKVVTAGLSIAFLPQFNVARIPTTVIGFVIIIMQGFLVVAMLILIVLGAISSYMSLTRNREEFHPRRLEKIRLKYFDHLEQRATDLPAPPPSMPEAPMEPYFNVTAVRRNPKIEDEDVDYVPALNNPTASQFSLPNRNSRADSMANSMRSHYSGYGNAPYGARVHRASWSSRDFQNWQQDEIARGESPLAAPSRTTSGLGLHTTQNSLSMAPLVRPSPSQNSIRPSTPTREQQRQFASQRVGYGM